MSVDELYENFNVEHWRSYKPFEAQYAKFLPHQILAGFKIEDVYQQFCNARASLTFMEVDDYGDLITVNDSTSLRFIRSKFLFDALANYNYCIDLSWQVFYLYYGQDDYGMIQNRERYERTTKECNTESLRYRMIGLAKRPENFQYLMGFFTASHTVEIRRAYNYIKHRGTFYIEGLGLNEHELPVGLDGSTLHMVDREEIDLDEWKNKLVYFDKEFYGYFDRLIEMIMPRDFLDSSFGISDIISLAKRLKAWEGEKQRRD